MTLPPPHNRRKFPATVKMSPEQQSESLQWDRLDDRLDQVERHVSMMSERIMRLDGSTVKLSNRIEALPSELAAALREHGQDCPGRVMAMDRITTRTRFTPHAGVPPSRPSYWPKGKMTPGQWVLWIGGAVGAAIAGAAYGLSKIFGL